MSYQVLANYKQEQALFAEFIESDTDPNILLFQGESGSGKSRFVEHCLGSVPQMPSLLMKMQSGRDSIPSLFTSMGRQCGWEKLPEFSNTVANLLERPSDVNDAVWNAGMHRHLRDIGKIGDLDSRLSRYQLLSDAWFADSMQFDSPFLLAIDTYENVSTLFDRWFNEDFLIGVANSSKMRVMVSGQTVPQIQDDWGFCASLQEMNGIHEAKAWMVWAEAVGYQVPSLEILAGVVLALKGNPSQIVEVIQANFPKRSGPIATKESIREQRKRFRQNMIKLFSLSELMDICFDMGIDYETLPEHGNKKGFVRELLAYAGRIGRLRELIQVCQEERPSATW